MKNWEPKTIIVRMPNWLGDLVMATPILTDLRCAYPNAKITAMCRFPICDLLQEDASIDELFCFSKAANQFVKREDKRDIIAKIRAGKFDLGILLPNSFSSAWWFWQGNVKRRIGYAYFPRSLLLTDAVEPQKIKTHQVDVYKHLLSPLSIPKSHTAPRLYVQPKEVEEALLLLRARGYKEGKRLIGVSPGAAYGAAKCWPADRFRKLAMDLLKDDLYLVFFGDASSDALIREICRDLPERVINLAGVTSIRQLICLIEQCDAFVTNDSGPMHIAAAVKTPLVALFGSTDETVTGPYGDEGAVVRRNVSCSPCLKRVCPIDFRCMTQISVEEVALRVRRCFER